LIIKTIDYQDNLSLRQLIIKTIGYQNN